MGVSVLFRADLYMCVCYNFLSSGYHIPFTEKVLA